MLSEQTPGTTVSADRLSVQTAKIATHIRLDVTARLRYSTIAILNKH